MWKSFSLTFLQNLIKDMKAKEFYKKKNYSRKKNIFKFSCVVWRRVLNKENDCVYLYYSYLFFHFLKEKTRQDEYKNSHFFSKAYVDYVKEKWQPAKITFFFTVIERENRVFVYILANLNIFASKVEYIFFIHFRYLVGNYSQLVCRRLPFFRNQK